MLLKKFMIGLSSQNGKCHCFVIFWPSTDLDRKPGCFYFALICFLKPVLAVKPSRIGSIILAYQLFCYGRLSIFLSCYNIKKYKMNRDASRSKSTNLEWICVSSISVKKYIASYLPLLQLQSKRKIIHKRMK